MDLRMVNPPGQNVKMTVAVRGNQSFTRALLIFSMCLHNIPSAGKAWPLLSTSLCAASTHRSSINRVSVCGRHCL